MSTTVNLVAIGHPNSGKSSLFNGLTGKQAQVGNWSGVTVREKKATLLLDEQPVTLVDLPGIYDLYQTSQTVTNLDEQITRTYLKDNQPDLILNVADATNLERHLYLTAQLLELGIPTILVLNKSDLMRAKGIEIDIEKLSI